MKLPDFTADQRRELTRLGLCPEQIEALRPVIGRVRLWIRPPAARNKTRAHLSETLKHAKALEKRLNALETMPAPDYRLAEDLLEERYFARDPFPMDGAATMLASFLPRLRAICEAADYSLSELNDVGPARNRTGNSAPVKRIWEALVSGWGRAHSPVGSSHFVRVRVPAMTNITDEAAREDSEIAEMLADARAKPAGPPYPEALMPSGGAFKDVVRLLYSAAGYTKGEPKRAIESFTAEWHVDRREALDALNLGIAAATD